MHAKYVAIQLVHLNHVASTLSFTALAPRKKASCPLQTNVHLYKLAAWQLCHIWWIVPNRDIRYSGTIRPRQCLWTCMVSRNKSACISQIFSVCIYEILTVILNNFAHGYHNGLILVQCFREIHCFHLNLSHTKLIFLGEFHWVTWLM